MTSTKQIGIETRERIVEFIKKFYAEEGNYPFVSEISRGVNLSSKNAWRQVEKLKQEGIVDRDYGPYTEVKLR